LLLLPATTAAAGKQQQLLLPGLSQPQLMCAFSYQLHYSHALTVEILQELQETLAEAAAAATTQQATHMLAAVLAKHTGHRFLTMWHRP